MRIGIRSQFFWVSQPSFPLCERQMTGVKTRQPWYKTPQKQIKMYETNEKTKRPPNYKWLWGSSAQGDKPKRWYVFRGPVYIRALV